MDTNGFRHFRGASPPRFAPESERALEGEQERAGPALAGNRSAPDLADDEAAL
jgi:hypothetical protein